jgi:acetylornithine deacetylase
MAVELMEAAPGRPNVVARVGPSEGRRLMFNGHLDVVDVQDMIHPPFQAQVDGGRLYGRGSSDMKGGVAAMCAAAARAADRLRCEVVIAAVVDEEFESVGTRALTAAGIRADAAIVTEPTRLAIGPAHRGFTWMELAVHGRAAHGSRYDLGVDAIMHAAAILREIDAHAHRELVQRTHALLGHASIHASTIAGGSGWSTYPDRCVVRLERRTMPGESSAAVLHEVQSIVERVRQTTPTLRADLTHVLTQAPSDVSPEAPIVRALVAAAGDNTLIAGVTAWTDAALLNAAGIPAICYGPGDMGMAHANEEWIDLEEVERATEVLARVAVQWHEVDA